MASLSTLTLRIDTTRAVARFERLHRLAARCALVHRVLATEPFTTLAAGWCARAVVVRRP